jgi:transcriptional regulator with XRE-family HTH domain
LATVALAPSPGYSYPDKRKVIRMTPHASPRADGTQAGGEDHALGQWIRSARTAQGVSQRALASRAGISRSYLCDIERGRGAQPSVGVLDKLATALGASRWDLLRAAGILEPATAAVDNSAERRLLALYRDLSESGRAAIERFARFTHSEEHRWIQPPLVDGEVAPGARAAPQLGPTLFDTLPPQPTGRGRRPARLQRDKIPG